MLNRITKAEFIFCRRHLAVIQEPNSQRYGLKPEIFIRTLYMFEAATMYSAL